VAGVADSPPASYGRAVAAPAGGRWLQYWRWHESNRQDRGVLRTGRHAGDWEMVQVRVDRGEQPVEAVYAQHSGSVIRPRLVVIAADLPSWMRFTGRWGASRASLPFGQSSPRGPAFQGVRWRDPAAFAASARSCMPGRCNEVGECDPRLGSKLPGLAPRRRESALAGGALGVAGLLAGVVVWRRRRRA
jgi:hypothetical protein